MPIAEDAKCSRRKMMIIRRRRRRRRLEAIQASRHTMPSLPLHLWNRTLSSVAKGTIEYSVQPHSPLSTLHPPPSPLASSPALQRLCYFCSLHGPCKIAQSSSWTFPPSPAHDTATGHAGQVGLRRNLRLV